MNIITASDYQMLLQPTRNISCRVNLLNFNLNKIESLEGRVLGGKITMDANSDIRRIMNIEMVIPSGSYSFVNSGEIWLDRLVQVYIGLTDIQTNETRWVNWGIFLINQPKISKSADGTILSFECVDLMSKLTGLRNGQLEDITTVIPSGSSIRDSMISTITQLSTFTRYIIADNPQEVPYDITIGTGGYVYDLIKELRDISPAYETFFNENGVFVYQKIPTGENEPIFVDNEIWSVLVRKKDQNISFQDVKNRVVVYGTIDSDGNQIMGEATDTNPDSPFYVNRIGNIVSVLSGGEYEKIYTNSLAQQRAEYELWLHTRMNDSIILESLPIYWLDVNKLIRLDIDDDGELETYIIKKITMGLGVDDTMSVEAIRYYPLYPDIVT